MILEDWRDDDILRIMPEVNQTRTGSAVPQFLLAVIFLAILGGAGGVLAGLAARHHDEALAGASQHSGGTGGQSPLGGPTMGAGSGPPTTQSSTSPTLCPGPMLEMANAGVLHLVFYLRTTGSEVWICKDDRGGLYYQGHRGQPNDAPLVEGTNALFLTDVTADGDTWVAVNRQAADGSTVEYHVSAQGLVIRHLPANGSPVPDQSEAAVR